MVRLLMALALAGAPPQEGEIEAKLKSVRVSLDFKNAALPAVVDYLREVSGLNIVISSKVEGKADDITIKVSDLSLRSVLNLILRPRGLMARVQDGVLMVCASVDEPVVLEIYDVRDLLYVAPELPGAEIELAVGGVVFGDPGLDVSAAEWLPLVELVKGHTGGKSWDESSRVSVSLQNGLLIVRQTSGAQREVRRLLGKLREVR